MTLDGRVEHGVVVLTGGARLADGTVVKIIPVEQAAGPSLPAGGQKPPYPVATAQKDALLALIGIWRAEHPPSDEEVEQIMEEHRMKKYG